MVKVEYENDCVGCPQGCINCGRKHSRYVYLICDKCGDEVDALYKLDGEELCSSCVLDNLEVITEDDCE